MVINFILEHLGEVWVIIASIVTIASIIVKWTPSQKDDEILCKVIKFLEWLSINSKKK